MSQKLKRHRIACINVGALLIFVVGFLLLFGRNASLSGSWKYVMNDRDDYLYWAYAQGATETPASDGNPFYIENRGQKQTVPYTASTLVGLASRLTGLHVLFFFPFWYILIPFLLWFSLYQCLSRLWRYPRFESAIFSLIFLLGTMFLKNSGYINILRFSRPADAMWMLFIWISFVMTLHQSKGKPTKTLTYLALGSSALVMWFNPFLAAMGLLVTFCEFGWQISVKRDHQVAKLVGMVLSVSLLSTALYFLYIIFNMSENPWVFEAFKQESRAATLAGTATVDLLQTDWYSLGLLGLALALVGSMKVVLRTQFSNLDRLMVSLVLLRVVFSNAHVFLPGKFQLATHAYYFVTIELLCYVGWLHEKIPKLLSRNWSRTHDLVAFPTLITLFLLTFFNDTLTFVRVNLAPWATHEILRNNDNALLHLGIFPTLLLFVFLYHRLKRVRLIMHHKVVLGAIVCLLCYFGYTHFPTTTRPYLKNFPFERAHAWLSDNAEAGSVVLTAPHNRTWTDYLILYTDLKTYIHPLGDTLSHGKENPTNYHRFLVYFNLLAGDLDAVKFENLTTTAEKLHHVRLDYVLLELDTPFLGNIARQLQDHVEAVYRDEKALILRTIK